MDIGKYNVQLIDAGRYRLDGGAMFGVVPRTLWEKEYPPDEKNRILLALNTLLLVGNEHVILIDTGAGDKFTEKYANIYAIDYSEHSLLKSLNEHGVQPEDVTDVIITHLHFDHVGGATRFEKDRASYLSENIDPLLDSGKVEILDGPVKLFEGVDILISDGHTFAQQMVLIYDEERKLLYAADLIPLAAHVAIPWVMAYDLSPMVTIKEKKELLQKAVDENWMIFFEHDPRTPCATIEKGEKGFEVGAPVPL